jgi:hypothetical protein
VEPPPLVVFLSSGRCGTQWLSTTLSELYPSRIEVEHEPIGPLYHPRRHFRAYERPDAILEVPEVRRHVERIERAGHYVETGWPLFAALPLLAERFPDRLRVVHLTRHPVPSALSHLAHSSYAGSPRDDAYTRLATLGPTDPGVFQTDYAARWDALSPYEKCLFWWTEVSLFGLELCERLPGIPFLRVKSEEMLAGDHATLERLVAHMRLAPDPRWPERANRKVDRWQHRTDRDVEPLQVRRHPAALDAMRRLGYSLEELDLQALEERYRGEPDPGLDRIGRYG